MPTRPLGIICLSSQPWDDPLWTNKQHVMSRLARQGHRVLFVDPVRTLAGHLLVNLRRRLRSEAAQPGDQGATSRALFAPRLKQGGDGLWAVSPLLLLQRAEWLTRINTWLVVRQILSAAKRARIGEIDLIWAYLPDYALVAEALANALARSAAAGPLVVYDCVDAYAEFPSAVAPARKRRVEQRERRLLRRADLVFTSAPSLHKRCSAVNPKSHLVPNVADFDVFSQAAGRREKILGGEELPADLRGVRRPLIGFVGALDDYKVDFELLQRIATERPKWSIILVGPCGHADKRTEITSARSLPNVHFLGVKPYADVPSYVAAFDVALIPYARNPYTDHVLPLKVHEYLAAGRPVVSTALPNLEHLSPAVRLADSPADFIVEVERALSEADAPAELAARQRIASQNTWEHRIGTMERLSREALEHRAGGTAHRAPAGAER